MPRLGGTLQLRPATPCRRRSKPREHLATRLGGWFVDDMFVLVYSESSFRGVEDDEHVVPGVGYDGAEAYLDLERTLENLTSGGSESRQGFGNRVDNQVSLNRPAAAVEHQFQAPPCRCARSARARHSWNRRPTL